ncbi:hypothetical protein J6TS1_31440 [Siminovitchia terrae]|uniref:DUF4179 domain-containing protein n=1 Tax=Siminovitchia terrae TaxID=1914933 RepID=A0A429XDP0_SIMTE|nr:DUF4179 domain-containing protein [Siminovitchia terrae]RST61575.1 DUF4179 domain-containing protein [Siminovitchia terrae]GIN97274.1 hypothetical protein J6TS1_31440 [Siminovitchia terrae]
MNDIEKQLNEEKRRLSTITAPEELEARLKKALHSAPPKRLKRSPLLKLAIISLIFIVATGYQFNALAYYGKKLLGFDEVMSGTLKELNDKGMGQVIEKKTALDDGTDFTINGIITDSNQLVMYYTLSNQKGLDDDTSDLFQPSAITGFLTDSNVESNTFMLSYDGTEIKGTMSFEPVSPFSKKLTLHYWDMNKEQMKEKSISFPYKPNKAMQVELKQKINKTIKVDKGTISFDSITASPTLTVIKGKMNVENFDRVHTSLDGIELIANGSPVQMVGGGYQSALLGSKFDVRFEALPKKLDSLELVVKHFAGYKILGEKIKLDSSKNEPVTIGGKEMIIQEVKLTSEGLEITIATDDDVMLDGVSIETKSGNVPLSTTMNQTEAEQEDGSIMKVRTLLFKSKTEPESLLIEGMHYMKRYDQKIEIPVK